MLEKIYLFLMFIIILIQVVKPMFGSNLLLLLFILNPSQFFPDLENYRLYLIVSVVFCASSVFRGYHVNNKNQIFYILLSIMYLFFIFLSIIFSGELASNAFKTIFDFLKVMFFSMILILFIKKLEEFTNILRSFTIAVCANACFAIYEQFYPIKSRMEGTSLYRSEGFQSNPNALGTLLLSTLPIAYYLYQHDNNKYFRLIGLLTFILSAIGIFCTVSRMGLLILIIIFAFLFKKNIKNITVYAFFGIIAILFFGFAKDLYTQRQTVTFTVSGRATLDASASMRLHLAKTAFSLWLKNPLFGVGLNNFDQAAKEQLGERKVMGSTHNAYLQLLSEQGVFSLFIYILFFVLAFKSLAISNKKLYPLNELSEYLKIVLWTWIFISFFGSIHAAYYLWLSLVFPLILQKIYLNEQSSLITTNPAIRIS